MDHGGLAFHWGHRTYVMGVVNVTPDSFSGDGVWDNPQAALERALRLEEDGADIIDVGGESTRPGSTPVSEEEEVRRVMPALELMSSRLRVPLSVDTYKSAVARCAVDAGAIIINDVWGLKKDPVLAEVAAQYGCSLILMHNQERTEYKELVQDTIASLRESMNVAMRAGVPSANIIVDPGIGFSKTTEHNLEVLRRLSEYRTLGQPLLVGTSRKSSIGLVLGLPTEERLEGTAATVALAIAGGADIVRVHDVREMTRVVRMSDAVIRGWPYSER